MIPIALGIGEGADWRAPLGRAVIGGVITSTFLTLLVILDAHLRGRDPLHGRGDASPGGRDRPRHRRDVVDLP
jgi:hypothetical protein